MFTWFLASSAFCLFEGATRLRKTRSGFRGLGAALGLLKKREIQKSQSAIWHTYDLFAPIWVTI